MRTDPNDGIYDPHKALDNRWKRWGERGVFTRMMKGLAPGDAAEGRHDRRDIPEGGMNTKLHAVANANGRPLCFFMMARQISDYTGAAALLDDSGYGALEHVGCDNMAFGCHFIADWFAETLGGRTC